VSVVFLPCLLKPISVLAKERLEVKDSGSMFTERGFKQNSGINSAFTESGVKRQEFIFEGVPELGGGFVEFLNTSGFCVPTFGKIVVNNSDNCTSGNKSEGKAPWFNWHSFFLGMYAECLFAVGYFGAQAILRFYES